MAIYRRYVLSHTVEWVDNTISFFKSKPVKVTVPVRPQTLNDTETPEQVAARQLTAMASGGAVNNQVPAMPTFEEFFRNPFAYPAILNAATRNGLDITFNGPGHTQDIASDNVQGPSVNDSNQNIAASNSSGAVVVNNNDQAVPAISSNHNSAATSNVSESSSDNLVASNSAVNTAPKRKRAANTPAAPVKKAKAQASTKHGAPTKSIALNDRDSEDDDDEEDKNEITLIKPTMTRTNRIVDPTNADDAALIAAAIKGGNEIYDDNAAELTSDIKKSITSKPELFRNVQWGAAAVIDPNAPDSEYPTHPNFSQFVVGRWERLADGTVFDQKRKLLIKLTNPEGRRMIFKNPPPKDWNDQKAITNLNKRASQQIRRNTPIRFREVVESYVHEERVWILNNLTQGKPRDGWKNFVREFNMKFAGSVLDGIEGVRPLRTHSSLTKEIERFGKEFYAKGKVPVPKSKDAEKVAESVTKKVPEKVTKKVAQSDKTAKASMVKRTIIKAYRRENGRICTLKIKYWGDAAAVSGKPAGYKPPTTTATAAKGSKKATKSSNSSNITKKTSGNPVRTRPSRPRASKIVAKGKGKAE